MLTTGEIKALCDQAKLFTVTPNDWRAPIERPIYVSPDLHRFLNGPLSSRLEDNYRARLQRLFDRFISGQAISVAFERHLMGTEIKRLSPRREEVWEFKIRDKRRPQLRVFGRFADAKVFFALTGPVFRSDCDYDAEIDLCQRHWDNLAPGKLPVYGRTLSDYFGSTKVLPFGNP
jgi:hypothetical protein